ncbi:hypothetical protein [Streptomyces phaeochromogenes]|uniref:hypothetical protein n=1 Tax=Streptomyces phaeochromogenes TaxID=1923 RepID=UPI003716FE32
MSSNTQDKYVSPYAPAADQVAAVQRHVPISVDLRTAAAALLEEFVAVAARHGITANDLAMSTSLPDVCVDAVLAANFRTKQV